ncbi:hypothetical protein ACFQ1S_44035 [Kibdelosporangium lantanae]|uniref:Secreted protein n=1 Tax=Kibdelosporangium lantanae TaxID=1497396 RepID=A0ABW3MRG5_9PSEU
MNGPTARRATVTIACMTLVMLGVSQPSGAGEVHQIKTAPSPSTGEPIAGGGSWIVNKPSGYYVGRAMPGWTNDDERHRVEVKHHVFRLPGARRHE